jgi:general secretion pathway protein F
MNALQWIVLIGSLLLLAVANFLLFSSRTRWHFPVVGWFYRMYARGQFMQMLGLMLETGKPLPEILDRVLASELLPRALAWRAEQLMYDLEEGQPLAASMAKRGLATSAMLGLITTAERAHNLPWALQALGDSLVRRSARLAHRMTQVVFPLTIVLCACVVAAIALALFLPLIALIESLNV